MELSMLISLILTACTHKQDLCIHYIFVGAADFFYLAKQMYFLFGKISPSFCPKISHTKHWSLMRGYVVSLQVTQKRWWEDWAWSECSTFRNHHKDASAAGHFGIVFCSDGSLETRSWSAENGWTQGKYFCRAEVLTFWKNPYQLWQHILNLVQLHSPLSPNVKTKFSRLEFGAYQTGKEEKTQNKVETL